MLKRMVQVASLSLLMALSAGLPAGASEEDAAAPAGSFTSDMAVPAPPGQPAFRQHGGCHFHPHHARAG